MSVDEIYAIAALAAEVVGVGRGAMYVRMADEWRQRGVADLTAYARGLREAASTVVVAETRGLIVKEANLVEEEIELLVTARTLLTERRELLIEQRSCGRRKN